MSGLGTCRDCGGWIYWQEYTDDDGKRRHVPFDEPGFFTMHWATCQAAEYIEVDGNLEQVKPCRKCGEPVYWETTARGKRRPMDAYQDIDNFWRADRVCHFETCKATIPTNNWRAHDRRSYRPDEKPQEDPFRKNGKVAAENMYRLKLWLPDLGLAWPCTRVDVTSAFRKRALETHPDMGGSAEAFIRVKRAYDALKDLVPV
jgi:hypothetical protein